MNECTKCKKMKEASAYSQGRKDCKACRREYNYKYYERNKEVIKVQNKAYRQTERGKRAQAISQQRQYKKFKQKYIAMGAVRMALQRGLLKREPCEVCGVVKVDGHHDDYKKLIEVRWLCGDHHREWHRNNKPKNRDII